MSQVTVFDPRITAAFTAAHGYELQNHLIMACYVGSVSHGTNDNSAAGLSDVDIFGVIIPPMKNIFGLQKFDNWTFKQDDIDCNIFSLDKYIRLLLKNNVNMISTLYMRPEHFTLKRQTFKYIEEGRDKFLSKKLVYSLLGYSNEQERRLETGATAGYMGEARKALVAQFGYDIKMGAHLYRLLTMANELMDTGKLIVYRHADGEYIKSIKRGELSLDQIRSVTSMLRDQIGSKLDNKTVRDSPDEEYADNLLVDLTAGWVWGEVEE